MLTRPGLGGCRLSTLLWPVWKQMLPNQPRAQHKATQLWSHSVLSSGFSSCCLTERSVIHFCKYLIHCLKRKKQHDKMSLEKAALFLLASQAVSALQYKMPKLGTHSRCHTPPWKDCSAGKQQSLPVTWALETTPGCARSCTDTCSLYLLCLSCWENLWDRIKIFGLMVF